MRTTSTRTVAVGENCAVRLHVENLHLAYGSHRVLEGICIGPLEGGRVVGLLGPNAAGKSTLVKTLAGVRRPNHGAARLVVDGEHLAGRRLREAVGYVPQELPTSASLTAFETVLISGRRGGMWRVGEDVLDDAAEAMQLMRIEDLAHRHLGELSGGQRQLVAMAQVLVRRPRLILLDEPTSALDLRHQIHLLQVVRERVREAGALGLVAIHDLNLAARYCDELVVLHRGEVHAVGRPGEVITPGMLDDVYGVRARVLHDEGVPVVSPVPE